MARVGRAHRRGVARARVALEERAQLRLVLAPLRDDGRERGVGVERPRALGPRAPRAVRRRRSDREEAHGRERRASMSMTFNIQKQFLIRSAAKRRA